jgi:hypothetical protein
MRTPPPIEEREFLKLVKNHGELCNGLRTLNLGLASSHVTGHAHHVGLCWLRLAQEHLADASATLAANRARATYSRAYYAVYNASKATRYIVNGAVSLKGDDHQRAGELPDDFPDVASWSSKIVDLYEHRLKADYDNWGSTSREMQRPPQQAVEIAGAFVDATIQYLADKFGITL